MRTSGGPTPTGHADGVKSDPLQAYCSSYTYSSQSIDSLHEPHFFLPITPVVAKVKQNMVLLIILFASRVATQEMDHFITYFGSREVDSSRIEWNERKADDEC